MKGHYGGGRHCWEGVFGFGGATGRVTWIDYESVLEQHSRMFARGSLSQVIKLSSLVSGIHVSRSLTLVREYVAILYQFCDSDDGIVE